MGQATEKCQNATMVLGFMHPHFLLIHSKIRDLYHETEQLPTMGITASGSLKINPKFVEKLDKDELGGVMAHEMLHLVLMHHDRQGLRDQWLWNVATDMCINKALKTDGIKLPETALYPPNDYNGELAAEPMYEYLKKNPDKAPKQPKTIMIDGKSIGDGQGEAGAGCGVLPDDNPQGQDPDTIAANKAKWGQVAVEARAMCSSIGKGTSAVATLLAPRQPKIDWRKVIRTGFQLACVKPSRDSTTFARKHRRSPQNGPQFPGWIGFDPSIAIITDVSGSMDRKWIEQIASECKNLMKRFQSVKVYLCVHTSDVVWSGWITQNTQYKMNEALNFSGGTDAHSAYKNVEKAGKFDVIVHFTDCELPGWPPVPRPAQLIVGAFGAGAHNGAYAKPPAGTRVIPCSVDGD